MTSFTVSFSYNIETVTQKGESVTVKYTLTSVDPMLSAEYTEVYPANMYFENIVPTMSDDDRNSQMDGNFRTLAQPTIESFAKKVKEAAESIKGTPGAGSGVITMSLARVVTDPNLRVITMTFVDKEKAN